MNFIISTIVFCALIGCLSAASILDAQLDSHWEEYKLQHSKEYRNNIHELERRGIWEENLKYIRQHNLEADLGHHTYRLGMNQYGDMKHEEFVQIMNGFNGNMSASKSAKRNIYMPPSNFQVPDAVDWRDKGYVNDIKDQKQCGSCWAFSAVASLEGQLFKKTGKLPNLSEQNLIDCSRKEGNQGCGGGLMDDAFQYVKDNNGIDTEASYPYEARNGRCRYNVANKDGDDTGFTDIESGDEDALTSAIASVGPISVAIDASHPSFQLYKTGLYSEKRCSSSKLDHGVVAVGYGSENGQDFYIVRNSWGTVWGMDGYVKMPRNSNNKCGIATQASYPNV